MLPTMGAMHTQYTVDHGCLEYCSVACERVKSRNGCPLSWHKLNVLNSIMGEANYCGNMCSSAILRVAGKSSL